MNELAEITPVLAGAGFASAVAWFLLRKMWSLLEQREDTIKNHIAHSAEVLSDLRLAIMELTFVLKGQKR